MHVPAAGAQHHFLVRGRRQLILEDQQLQVAALQVGDAGQVSISLTLQQLEQIEPDPQPGGLPARAMSQQVQAIGLELNLTAWRCTGDREGQ